MIILNFVNQVKEYETEYEAGTLTKKELLSLVFKKAEQFVEDVKAEMMLDYFNEPEDKEMKEIADEVFPDNETDRLNITEME